MSNVAFLEGLIEATDVARLASGLMAAASPNPPGDVTAAASVATAHLDAHGIAYRRTQPVAGWWNITSSIEGNGPGPRMMFSGHLDTFPLLPGQRSGTSGEPKRVYGRGAVDMKGGVAALLSAYSALNATRQHWPGSVGLCLVCDEETFGPHGARSLQQSWPGFAADAALSAEPSGRGVVRYGERGFVWGQATFAGDPGHAAYASPANNAIVRTGRFLSALAEWVETLAPGAEGAHRPTLNVGTIRGGEKLNLQPSSCTAEIDLRVPFGIEAPPLADAIARIAVDFDGTFTLTHCYEANASDTAHPLFSAMSAAIKDVTGSDATFTLGLGCTDNRLWRGMGTPVGVYGGEPTLQGKVDEWIGFDELGEIARVHAQTTARFLLNPS